jgi:hypothetical protein
MPYPDDIFKGHITYHFENLQAQEGEAGAFHIVIDSPTPKKYYRIAPAPEGELLKFKDIGYIPRQDGIYGKNRQPFEGRLEGRMDQLLTLINEFPLLLLTQEQAVALRATRIIREKTVEKTERAELIRNAQRLANEPLPPGAGGGGAAFRNPVLEALQPVLGNLGISDRELKIALSTARRVKGMMSAAAARGESTADVLKAGTDELDLASSEALSVKPNFTAKFARARATAAAGGRELTMESLAAQAAAVVVVGEGTPPSINGSSWRKQWGTRGRRGGRIRKRKTRKIYRV